MSNTPGCSVISHFGAIVDPRDISKVQHKLIDIITISLSAVICGADEWTAVERFGHAKYDWFATFLELPNGIPSHDTFNRVFSLIDPHQFGNAFLSWTTAVSKSLSLLQIAVDGKTLRGSHDRANGVDAIQMISAWATQNSLVLAQMKVEDNTNEIPMVPKILQGLAIAGCIVSIDAMGCQTKIAEEIVDRGADYVFSLKGNQSKTHDQVVALFEKASDNDSLIGEKYDFWESHTKKHGRVEWRRVWVTDELDEVETKARWKGLQCVVMVEREWLEGGSWKYDSRYFLTSLEKDAQKIGEAVRSHWEIENGQHWVLDVAFREDECRIRKGNGAENMAVLRRIALNLLKQEKTAKVGTKTKRLMAGWDSQYLLKLLSILDDDALMR